MDSQQNRRVVLLPIKPEYARKILNGEKKIEFRKRRFAADVQHVIIYASHPVKRIVGFFTIAAIEEASPRTLWRRYRTVGGISYGDFSEYYYNKDTAVGIHVRAVASLANPVSLESIGVYSGAPQSFAYLAESVLEKLAALQ